MITTCAARFSMVSIVFQDFFERYKPKKDRLHMNEKGYKIWTEVVREALAL